MNRSSYLPVLIAFALVAVPAWAQDQTPMSEIPTMDMTEFEEAAMEIWELAELGYQETESSRVLQDLLSAHGFRVEAGVAGMPTAFIATFGSGGPVLGLMGEYDALPGLSQEAGPERAPRVEGAGGHACGHHLFGAGSAAAAVAVKEWLESSGREGTIKFYGTPAEEGGSGKVYMAREGAFDGVDAVLHWHPGDRNDASASSSLANTTGKFRFSGIASHAAAAPHNGRSALDGVEAMNHMANMMREHVPQETRIHYVITDGGGPAPNVVPQFAEVYYYVRHPLAAEVKSIFERLVKISEGAALGTDTKVEHEIISGVHSLLPNETLGRLMHESLESHGGIEYSPDEMAFANSIRETMMNPSRSIESATEIQPFQSYTFPASTDVGDVSWIVPTVGLSTATWVPGTSAHTWQAVASGGTTIGLKGMGLAARTLALTAVKLYSKPELLQKAKREFDERRGDDFIYEAMLGDRTPPLDYRAAR